jgi:hypothetical protein
MYWQPPNDDTRIQVSPLSRFTIGALVFALLFFGIFPRPL